MNSWDSFDCVESIELKVSSCEAFGEGTIAWIKFIGEFMLSWQLGTYIINKNTIVHIISPIDGWSYLKPMIRIFICWILFDWELGCLFELLFWWNTIFFKLLLNYLIFDESLCLFEIIDWIHNLWVGRYHFLLNIEFLCPNTILSPCFINKYLPVP